MVTDGIKHQHGHGTGTGTGTGTIHHLKSHPPSMYCATHSLPWHTKTIHHHIGQYRTNNVGSHRFDTHLSLRQGRQTVRYESASIRVQYACFDTSIHPRRIPSTTNGIIYASRIPSSRIMSILYCTVLYHTAQYTKCPMPTQHVTR